MCVDNSILTCLHQPVLDLGADISMTSGAPTPAPCPSLPLAHSGLARLQWAPSRSTAQAARGRRGAGRVGGTAALPSAGPAACVAPPLSGALP